MYKVTIEGGNMKEPIVLEYEHVSFQEETGINSVFVVGAGHYGHRQERRPNGHSRAIVKAWSGCERFEDFVEDGEVTLCQF